MEMTPEQALSILDQAAAQAAVTRNLARMVIALRNKTWPNLEGSE